MKKTNRAASAEIQQPAARKRRRRKTRRLQMALGIVAGILLLLVLIVYLSWRALLGQVNIVGPGEQTLPSEFDLPTESLVNPPPVLSGITNILLLGVDNRDDDISNIDERSDSMMILTIDQNNRKLKLTSLQRDMLVYLPGKQEPVKINVPNARGGPALALRVVNDTFRLDIQDFMVINMRGMEQMVDLAGGVLIDVQEKEIPYLNANVNGENSTFSDTPASPLVTQAGLQILDGRQAVAYARIRKLDSDYKRMQRQRTVIQALLDAFMSTDLTTKGHMVTQGLSLITTNLSAEEITEFAFQILPLMNQTIDQLQIPIKGYFYEDARATWVNRCDFNGMIPLLQEFIFGKTFPFDPVKEIAGAPNSSIPLPTIAPSATPSPEPSPSETTEETTTVATTSAGETTTGIGETTGETTEETTTGTVATTAATPPSHTKATTTSPTTTGT